MLGRRRSHREEVRRVRCALEDIPGRPIPAPHLVIAAVWSAVISYAMRRLWW